MRYLILLSFIPLINSCSEYEVWRGIVVEPEDRCSLYNKSEQYPYPQEIEKEIIVAMGGRIYDPYTGTYFASRKQTDIEHIVATSEGHDSGLCKASKNKRIAFATDLLNLTLAAPSVNRCSKKGKCGLDAGEWMPVKNQCWFAYRVVQVKRKYNLSADLDEVNALNAVLSNCSSPDLVF